jgi:hypothetical protein
LNQTGKKRQFEENCLSCVHINRLPSVYKSTVKGYIKLDISIRPAYCPNWQGQGLKEKWESNGTDSDSQHTPLVRADIDFLYLFI